MKYITNYDIIIVAKEVKEIMNHGISIKEIKKTDPDFWFHYIAQNTKVDVDIVSYLIQNDFFYDSQNTSTPENSLSPLIGDITHNT